MINTGKRKKDWKLIISLSVILLVSAGAVGAPVIAPFAYDLQNTDAVLEGPGPEHWMGTDRLGRDLFSRLLYGARVSMTVGVVTAALAVILGTVYGAVSAYIGGRIDNLLMRFVDVVYSLPDLLLIILVTVLIGRGITGILIALTMVSWVTVARITRGEVLKIKDSDFVEAARAIGVSHTRILLFHILPNMAGVLIVTLTFRIPVAILSESTLSFIGLGIAPPFASWGSMAKDGWTAMMFHPHLILFPSLVLFVTSISFNLMGDAIRDRLDPGKSR